jgi:hypothetical protein
MFDILSKFSATFPVASRTHIIDICRYVYGSSPPTEQKIVGSKLAWDYGLITFYLHMYERITMLFFVLTQLALAFSEIIVIFVFTFYIHVCS